MTGKPNLDVIGQKFGLLTVIRLATPEEKDSVKAGAYGGFFYCKCDCGGEKIARGSHLRAGLVKSCGCVNAKRKANAKARAEARAKAAEARAKAKGEDLKKEKPPKPPKLPKPPKPPQPPKRENPYRTTMQKYERVKRALCEKHNRMCLTTKCPLAKFGCYDFITLSELFLYVGVNGKAPVIKAIKQAAKDNGIEL